MLKNSSDIRLSKPEFQNQCENETRGSSSSSYQNSFDNISFKNCCTCSNFPPGFPRQRLNGLKNCSKNTAFSRSINTRSKSSESSLASLDSYLACGYAARKPNNSNSGCCSKHIERECDQNCQKNSKSSETHAEVCGSDSGKRHSQLKTVEATKSPSKVNVGETCEKYPETKLKQLCESSSSTCTFESGGSNRKTEELCRHCFKPRKKFSGGRNASCESISSSQTEFSCECPSKTCTEDSHEIDLKTDTENSSKEGLRIKQEPGCSRWGYSLSSKMPERPLYTSTVFKSPHKHNLHKRNRYRKHSGRSRLKRRAGRHCRWKKMVRKKIARKFYNRRKNNKSRMTAKGNNKNKRRSRRSTRSTRFVRSTRFARSTRSTRPTRSTRSTRSRRSIRSTRSKRSIGSTRSTGSTESTRSTGSTRLKRSIVHKRRDSTNNQKITEKAMSLFQEDMKERSPGEINIQNKWNALSANRKFYYLWIALGNDPLSEDPYQNYIKFKQHNSNRRISLADLESWSCLPYNNRMLFTTEAFLARLFRTNEAPSETLYKEYFSNAYKRYKPNNLKESPNDSFLSEGKRSLKRDSEDSLVGQDAKRHKLDNSSCSCSF